MRSMARLDWDFLVSLCDRNVREYYARAQQAQSVQQAYGDEASPRPPGHVHDQHPFMHHCASLRGKMDRYVHAYLHDEKRAAKGLSLASGRRVDRMKPMLEGLECQILGEGVAYGKRGVIGPNRATGAPKPS